MRRELETLRYLIKLKQANAGREGLEPPTTGFGVRPGTYKQAQASALPYV